MRAWPEVLRQVPDAALLIVGAGRTSDLKHLAERSGQTPSVHFTGPVPQAELPAHYAAGDVFAMPCRTRRGGLDVEGLGIVYLEASATGLPVLGGDSGGAPTRSCPARPATWWTAGTSRPWRTAWSPC